MALVGVKLETLVSETANLLPNTGDCVGNCGKHGK